MIIDNKDKIIKHFEEGEKVNNSLVSKMKSF